MRYGRLVRWRKNFHHRQRFYAQSDDYLSHHTICLGLDVDSCATRSGLLWSHLSVHITMHIPAFTSVLHHDEGH